MGFVVCTFVFVSSLYVIYAEVIINEVELNPIGSDSGNEWVEFFNDDWNNDEKEIDLEGWKIFNNDGDELVLNFSFSEYYVFEFENQWLDNSDEKVILVDKEGREIWDTGIIVDSKNNDKTFQYCEDKYIFISNTRKKENDCGEVDDGNDKDDVEKEGEDDEKDDGEDDKEGGDLEDSNEKKEIVKKEDYKTILDSSNKMIKLDNGQDQKNSVEENSIIYKSKNEYIKEGAVYGFALLCIFLIVLLIKER